MPEKFNALARYNGERARGIAHTPGWDAKMAELQQEFNERERQRSVEIMGVWLRRS